MKKIDKRDKLYEYAEMVRKAKLDCKAKALLWHYAYTYNWSQKKPSWYSQRVLCAEVGIAPATYHDRRKYLERLGWIKVTNRGFNQSCLVIPTIGQDDPEYENRSWAKWHSSNRTSQWVENETQDRLMSLETYSELELLDSVSESNDSDSDWDDLMAGDSRFF